MTPTTFEEWWAGSGDSADTILAELRAAVDRLSAPRSLPPPGVAPEG